MAAPKLLQSALSLHDYYMLLTENDNNSIFTVECSVWKCDVSSLTRCLLLINVYTLFQLLKYQIMFCWILICSSGFSSMKKCVKSTLLSKLVWKLFCWISTEFKREIINVVGFVEHLYYRNCFRCFQRKRICHRYQEIEANFNLSTEKSLQLRSVLTYPK